MILAWLTLPEMLKRFLLVVSIGHRGFKTRVWNYEAQVFILGIHVYNYLEVFYHIYFKYANG